MPAVTSYTLLAKRHYNHVKFISSVIQVSTSWTPAQMEAGLNAKLNEGWTFVGVYTVGSSKYFAVFTKQISV
jgi:hypothetical protein